MIRDDAGTEAARFRAAASGFVVLYDGDGRLRFAGGLTSSRGHEGDSFGRRRILAVLSGQTPDRDDAPVFGCALGIAATRRQPRRRGFLMKEVSESAVQAIVQRAQQRFEVERRRLLDRHRPPLRRR